MAPIGEAREHAAQPVADGDEQLVARFVTIELMVGIVGGFSSSIFVLWRAGTSRTYVS